jgi:hypothetical protein
VAEEFSISVEGIEEVCALLSEAPKDVVRRTLAKALTAATVPVVQTLNSKVPELTGDLADHVATDVAIWEDGSGGTAEIGFGNEGWKARLVEYGHRMIGHKPLKKYLGQVAAHPFMRPSAADSAEAAVEAFGNSVQDSIGTIPLEDLKSA